MTRVFAMVLAAVLLVPTVASAQLGGWVDVNFGVAASTGEEQTYTFVGPLYRETLALAASYPKPSMGASFDFGGGIMFNPLIGLGVTFTGQAHEDTAGMAITVPHPFFFNAADTAAAPTAEELSRAESGTHITLMLAPVRGGNFQFRVFGGPTFFRLKADMVQDIRYTQVATPFSLANVVTITEFNQVEAEGTGWGFHAGADASYFFTRVVGIGGIFRFSQGNVTLEPEPLSELSQDVGVGGIHFGGGLRLRF